jgi:hypothetical protein
MGYCRIGPQRRRLTKGDPSDIPGVLDIGVTQYKGGMNGPCALRTADLDLKVALIQAIRRRTLPDNQFPPTQTLVGL